MEFKICTNSIAVFFAPHRKPVVLAIRLLNAVIDSVSQACLFAMCNWPAAVAMLRIERNESDILLFIG